MKTVSKKSNQLIIAIVSDAIYPYNKGGKEKRIYELSTRLAKAGHDVHIYCMKWWGADQRPSQPASKPRQGRHEENENHRIENGVHLHAISKLYPLYSNKRRSFREAILFSLSCFKLIKEDFDVIDVDHMPHMVLFPTKIVALLKRKKLYATWNEVWGKEYWKEYLGQLGTIAYMVEWLSARMPDKIIAVSEHTKEKLIKDLKINTEIFVVPNGIDLETIQKVKPAKEKSDIIFAGRLLSHKNVDLLLKAISLIQKSFPHVKAFIIGEGPEKKKLKKMITNLKLEKNVKMLGFLENHNKLYALMKASKVFVFPSTREGFGIVALEANASEIPVITVNHKDNATKDLIKNGSNGYIVEPNEKNLAEKIITYLSSSNSQKGYINAVKNYDWGVIAKKIEEIYTK